MRQKKPGIEVSKYNRPAVLAAFFVEVISPILVVVWLTGAHLR
jgi:hypothetical protein